MKLLLDKTTDNIDLLAGFGFYQQQPTVQPNPNPYILLSGDNWFYINDSGLGDIDNFVDGRGMGKTEIENNLRKIKEFNQDVFDYLKGNLSIDIRIQPLNIGREKLNIDVKLGKRIIGGGVKIITTNALGQRHT